MILWPIALDENGQEIHIKDAPAHGKYTCVNCHQPMKARKGEYRVIHFAHMVENPSCSCESHLHLDLKNRLFDRITKRDGIAVIHNGKRIELSKYSKCKKEHYVGALKPDIYVVIDDIEYFFEICVTSPCSEDKINSGKRIIEIKTTDYDSRAELSTGDVTNEGEHYSLKFYNFPLEPRIRKTSVARKFPLEQPFMTHDGAENEFGLYGDVPRFDPSLCNRSRVDVVNDGYINERIEPQLKSGTVIVERPKAKARLPWNPNDAIPPICHYILYDDGNDKVVSVDLDRVMLRVEPKAILELGVSIADNQFSYEVGRRYAADKGLIDKEQLTNIERSLDMAAIKKWLGYHEIGRVDLRDKSYE